MNNTDILKKIIAEDGNCSWSRPSICKICPLSRLKTKSDGSYMSCVESLGVQDLSEEEADKKYLAAALNALLAEAVEEIIKDDGDGVK